MSAADALKAARAAGIQLGVDGEDLALTASVPPPATVIDLLASHKAEVVALLRLSRDGWSAQDWQVFFDERAGIVEFDAGLPRAEAEAHAFACCVVEWLNRNPAQSLAGAVSTVVTSITPTIRCCPTASNPPATPSCIHVAGPPGTRPGKPRPLRH